MEVYQHEDKFAVQKLVLYSPKPVQGGGYYANLKVGNNDFLIQTPKIITKSGIHKTGKKVYSDLLIGQENMDFINYMVEIEERVKELIILKGKNWFKQRPSKEDIEERWNSCLRQYKSKNILIRTSIAKKNEDLDLKIWNSSSEKIDPNAFSKEDKIIGIYKIKGLKFSSTSFSLDIELKQLMVFKNENYEKCLIKEFSTQSEIFDDINNDVTGDTDIENSDHDSYEDSHDDSEGDSNSEYDSDSNSEYTGSDEYSDEDDEETENTSTVTTASHEKIDATKLNQTINDITNQIIKTTNEANELMETFESQQRKKRDVDIVQESQKQKLTKNISNDLEKNNNNNVNNLEERHKTNNNNEKVDISVNEKQDITNQINNLANSKKNSGILEEVNLEINNDEPALTLKNPKQVYLNIYKNALNKARKTKEMAIKEYLKAKKIKQQYLLNDVESSDGEELDGISE